jgi:methylthioribose-1-phosphate isomerase
VKRFQTLVDLGVTVVAKKNALLDLANYPAPTSRVAAREHEVLRSTINVMEAECTPALRVAAQLALAAFVFEHSALELATGSAITVRSA